MPKKVPTSAQKGNTKPSERSKSGRLFCFTHFDSHFSIPLMKPLNNEWTYLLMGREICPKTKAEHFQSFIYTSKKDKITPKKMADRLEKHFGKRPHTTLCNGDIEDNFDYCTKDKDYYEWGNKPEQGKRTDLNEIKNSILAGKKVEDIMIEKPIIYHQYGRTLDKIEDIAMRKKFRTTFTKGYWYYGKTGCGKSELAFKDFSPETHYIYPYDNNWCDAYKQQKYVIIDDFRGQLPFNELLRMVDKHPNYYLRRRGKEPMPFNSEIVIITSSLHPKEVYHNLDLNDKLDQLYRRFTITEIKPCDLRDIAPTHGTACNPAEPPINDLDI